MDQAAGLRDLIKDRANRLDFQAKQGINIYTIASGKGGVGKTNIAVNLAIALQRRGKKVLLIDADLGMANVDVVMGIYPKYTLYDLLFRGRSLKEIVITSYEGVKILPGGSGIMELALLDMDQQEAIAQQFMTFGDIDLILIDTGAGISKNSLSFISFSQEMILVTTPEPTALTDAYGIIKVLTQYKLNKNVKVVVNRCPDLAAGETTFDKLNTTAKMFLNKDLESVGNIIDDNKVTASVMNQVPFIIQHPNCMASKCINAIADELIGHKNNTSKISSIRQVYNRLIKVFG